MERLEQLRELIATSRRLRDTSRELIARAKERNADARNTLQAVWLKREMGKRQRAFKRSK
jgi:hypothetical protein